VRSPRRRDRQQLSDDARQTFTDAGAASIADAPPLKAAVATNDPPTVQDVVDDFPSQLNSKLLLVQPERRVLGTVGSGGRSARSRRHRPSRRRAGAQTTSLVRTPDGLLQLVTVPSSCSRAARPDSSAPERRLSGSTGVAAQLKEITGSESRSG
jgi:hypothetical protein